MKHLFFLWLVLCISGISLAQTIIVKDKETNKALEFVTIYNESKNSYALTNAEGQADISDFINAERIEISTFGYKGIIMTFAELQGANFELFLEMTNLNLEEVVISGTRWRQSSQNIPSKIISISPKEVEFQNPQTAADLLGTSGKVYIQKSQQGGGSPMIRGFATNRLLYTVDGVRMNNAIFRGGNIQNVINLDPFATEKTEVLFGPGSVIYGSDAIGGVMNFISLTPQLTLTNKTLVTGKAVARYASANQEKTGHVDVNVGWKKWASVTSLSYWNYDNLRQGSNGPDDYLKSTYVEREDTSDVVVDQSDELLQIPTAYSQINFMQKIRFKLNNHWDFQYGFHFSETTKYGRYDRHNRFRNDLPRYAEWDYGPQKWMMNNLNLTHNGNNKAYDQLTLRLAFQLFQESRLSRNFQDQDRSSNKEQVNAYSINLDFIKNTGQRNTLFYGVEYVLNDVISTGEIRNIITENSEEGPARYPNSNWSSIAAYINDEYKISPKFSLQTGLRYNQYILNADFSNNQDYYDLAFSETSLNNGALTGSFGGVYRPAQTWLISSNFGTAFRAPNVDDMGKIFDSEAGAVTIPNPNLKAEYAYNIDVGAAKVFKNVVKIDLSAYYTLLENAMVRRNDQLNGQDSIMYEGEISQVQSIQNASFTKVYGLQTGIEIKLPAGFSISSDLNYQVGQDALDDGTTGPSRHAPPLFGISRLNFKGRKIHLQFNVNYQGVLKNEDLALEEQNKDEIYAKDVNGGNYAPSWYTLNFKAMYDFTKAFAVNAGIENITDQRYRPYSSGISGPGRNFIFSMQYKF